MNYNYNNNQPEKIKIGNEYCYLYSENLKNDSLIFMKYGNERVTTGSIKKTLNDVINHVEMVIGAASIVDDKFEKYKRALLVYKVIKNILYREPRNNKLSKEDMDIAMDIAEEIVLYFEKDENKRANIKCFSLLTKTLFMI